MRHVRSTWLSVFNITRDLRKWLKRLKKYLTGVRSKFFKQPAVTSSRWHSNRSSQAVIKEKQGYTLKCEKSAFFNHYLCKNRRLPALSSFLKRFRRVFWLIKRIQPLDFGTHSTVCASLRARSPPLLQAFRELFKAAPLCTLIEKREWKKKLWIGPTNRGERRHQNIFSARFGNDKIGSHSARFGWTCQGKQKKSGFKLCPVVLHSCQARKPFIQRWIELRNYFWFRFKKKKNWWKDANGRYQGKIKLPLWDLDWIATS